MPCDADVMFDYRNSEICSRYQQGQTKDYEGIVQQDTTEKSAAPSRLRFFPAVARRQQFCRDLQKRLSFGGEKLYNILQCFILGRAGP